MLYNAINFSGFSKRAYAKTIFSTNCAYYLLDFQIIAVWSKNTKIKVSKIIKKNDNGKIALGWTKHELEIQ